MARFLAKIGFSKARQTTTEFEIEDHIRGTLYGNAVGDAIGLMTEFMDKEEIKENYGQLKHFEFEDKIKDIHRVRWANGDWTDDTDQMILILDSLLANNGKVDQLDYGKRIRYWSRNGFPELGDYAGMGIGATTNKTLNNPAYLENPHAAAELVWEANGKKVAPNGGVMRTSILGVYQFHDIEQVKLNTLEICKTTHFDPRCQASCIAVTTAIALMLQRQDKHLKSSGDYNINSIMKESFAHASQCFPDENGIDEFKKHMFASSLSALKLDEPGKIGYTLKCMGAGFWALRQDDFRTAIEKLTREGGDADTNGAVAGALLGCKLGYQGLPESWVNKLKHKDWFEERIIRFIQLMSLKEEAQPVTDEASKECNTDETSKKCATDETSKECNTDETSNECDTDETFKDCNKEPDPSNTASAEQAPAE